jgi:hypothetical protein
MQCFQPPDRGEASQIYTQKTEQTFSLLNILQAFGFGKKYGIEQEVTLAYIKKLYSSVGVI